MPKSIARLAFGLLLAFTLTAPLQAHRCSSGRRGCYATAKTIMGALEMYELDHDTAVEAFDDDILQALHREGYLQSLPTGSCVYMLHRGDLYCQTHGFPFRNVRRLSCRSQLSARGEHDPALLASVSADADAGRCWCETFYREYAAYRVFWPLLALALGHVVLSCVRLAGTPTRSRDYLVLARTATLKAFAATAAAWLLMVYTGLARAITHDPLPQAELPSTLVLLGVAVVGGTLLGFLEGAACSRERDDFVPLLRMLSGRLLHVIVLFGILDLLSRGIPYPVFIGIRVASALSGVYLTALLLRHGVVWATMGLTLREVSCCDAMTGRGTSLGWSASFEDERGVVGATDRAGAAKPRCAEEAWPLRRIRALPSRPCPTV